jgi:hypothetical protein
MKSHSNPQNINDQFLSVKDVGQILKLKTPTIYDMIKQGVFPAIKIGRTIRIRKSDLESSFEANRTFSRNEALS